MATPTANLTALVYDLVIPQAADWPGVSFPIYNPDHTLADLTGCTARGQIRPTRGSSELYFTWSTDPDEGEGLITIDPAGTLTIRVLGSESAGWRFTEAQYDIVLTNPTAPVGLRSPRVVMGDVTVSKAATF